MNLWSCASLAPAVCSGNCSFRGALQTISRNLQFSPSLLPYWKVNQNKPQAELLSQIFLIFCDFFSPAINFKKPVLWFACKVELQILTGNLEMYLYLQDKEIIPHSRAKSLENRIYSFQVPSKHLGAALSSCKERNQSFSWQYFRGRWINWCQICH